MPAASQFSIVLDSPTLREAVQPAIDKANTEAAREDGDHRGVVIAQVYIEEDGVRLRGGFVEHEWAKPIYDALRARGEGSSK